MVPSTLAVRRPIKQAQGLCLERGTFGAIATWPPMQNGQEEIWMVKGERNSDVERTLAPGNFNFQTNVGGSPVLNYNFKWGWMRSWNLTTSPGFHLRFPHGPLTTQVKSTCLQPPCKLKRSCNHCDVLRCCNHLRSQDMIQYCCVEARSETVR